MLAAVLPVSFTVDPAAGTGGGCLAIEVVDPGRRVLLLTDDADLPTDGGDVVLSYVDASGEDDGYAVVESSAGPEALRAAVVAWVSGSPIRD